MFLFLFTTPLYAKIPAKSWKLKDADCLRCHTNIDMEKFNKSIHGSVSCTDCHFDLPRINPIVNMEKAPHHISAIGKSKTSRIELCLKCHDEDSYSNKGHSGKVLEGNSDSADCGDCHGVHYITKIKNNRAAKSAISNSCINCHGDKIKMERNNLLTSQVRTFRRTYHGKAHFLESATAVAGCADCHTGHNILPAHDSNSILTEINQVKICGKCHENSNENLVKFISHPDVLDRNKYPLLFYIFVIMSFLLVFNSFIFIQHTVLWWRKSYVEKHRLKKSFAKKIPVKKNQEDYVERFSPFYRAMHYLLMFSFLGLVLTGMPLLFSGSSWALFIMNLLGGVKAAGIIHRVLAVVQFTLFIFGATLVLRFLWDRKKEETIRSRFFGKDSLFFRKKDWRDLKAMIMWFLNRGEKPEFDRWAYWEKVDVFAFFFGMFTIGGSGVILWFPDFFTGFLPGWIFNIAIIIHSFEAMVAAVTIFIAHFFNTHLMPGKFPMDMVIFSGKIKMEELAKERPLYYKRLIEENKLHKYKRNEPKSTDKMIWGFWGFTSLFFGLLFMILIIVGFFQNYA